VAVYHDTRVAHRSYSVQLNANSPLLRLPAEIRNNIWAYACGGNKVMLPARWNTTMKGGAVDLIRTADGTLTTFSFHSTTRKPAAFHLPEVCRQIYAETALISYKTNTFVCTEVVVSRRHPMARLMAAHRRAIKSLELFPYECACIVHGSDTALVSILRAWPNICRVIVTPEAMNWVRIWRNGQTTERADWNEEQWHAWVKDCLTRCKEGGFEVVFEG
jgi:hypothetical protein